MLTTAPQTNYFTTLTLFCQILAFRHASQWFHSPVRNNKLMEHADDVVVYRQIAWLKVCDFAGYSKL